MCMLPVDSVGMLVYVGGLSFVYFDIITFYTNIEYSSVREFKNEYAV